MFVAGIGSRAFDDNKQLSKSGHSLGSFTAKVGDYGEVRYSGTCYTALAFTFAILTHWDEDDSAIFKLQVSTT